MTTENGRLYKHICGYPVRKEDELKRCPGCGGRITPWNTSPAAQDIPAPLESGDEALGRLAFWLKSQHPKLAESLRQALADDLENEQPEAMERLLSALRDHLQTSEV